MFSNFTTSKHSAFPGSCFANYSWTGKIRWNLIRDVNKGSKLLGTVAQKDYTIDHPKTTDFYYNWNSCRNIKNS